MRELLGRGRGRLTTSIPAAQTCGTVDFHPDVSISRCSFERRGRGVCLCVWASLSGYPEDSLTWRKDADGMCR